MIDPAIEAELEEFEAALVERFTDWRTRGLPWRPLKVAWMRAESRTRDALAKFPSELPYQSAMSAEAMPVEMWAAFWAQDLDIDRPADLKRARERHRWRRRMAENVPPSLPSEPGSHSST